MSPGYAAGYRREAFIGFTKISEAVCGDQDLVNLALPFAHEPRSRLEPWLGVILPGGAQRVRNLAKLGRCLGFQAAIS